MSAVVTLLFRLGIATAVAAVATAQLPVRLNEFIALNVTGIVDENGQFEDWLELYNDSPAAFAVGGLWLSDDPARAKWQIPAATTIAPFGTLLVWCDEDGSQGPLHANFKLAAAGESLVLFAADGTTVIDRVDFGLQTQDVATGRVLDGSSTFVRMLLATPNAPNRLPACGTRDYLARAPGVHTAEIALLSAPQIGTTAGIEVILAPASSLCVFALALAPAHLDLGPFGLSGEVALVDPASTSVLAVVQADPAGLADANLPIPADGRLVGVRAFAQVVAIGNGEHDTSTAIEILICP